MAWDTNGRDKEVVGTNDYSLGAAWSESQLPHTVRGTDYTLRDNSHL